MRIVADVNVIVSATIAPLGAPRAVVTAWRQGQLQLATSDGIIAEVRDKLSSPRIARRYHLSGDDVRTVVATLRTQAEIIVVPLHAIAKVTGDPEDDYVLATVVEGQVDYLVTGDKGLLALGSHHGIAILSPREFVELLQSSS
jgi:putative PIN family toxin of toxin-antitoxin system